MKEAGSGQSVSGMTSTTASGSQRHPDERRRIRDQLRYPPPSVCAGIASPWQPGRSRPDLRFYFSKLTKSARQLISPNCDAIKTHGSTPEQRRDLLLTTAEQLPRTTYGRYLPFLTSSMSAAHVGASSGSRGPSGLLESRIRYPPEMRAISTQLLPALLRLALRQMSVVSSGCSAVVNWCPLRAERAGRWRPRDPSPARSDSSRQGHIGRSPGSILGTGRRTCPLRRRPAGPRCRGSRG